MSREDKPEWIRINLNAFIRDIGYPLGSIGFVALWGESAQVHIRGWVASIWEQD